MIYVMSKRMYWKLRDGHDNADPMTHEELIAYLNRTFSLCGTIIAIQFN
ncbi:MAG: hypothetical protein J7559_02910 [Cohnella sp.]|nr:hypothetical protein [Cohnella sp.]